MIIATFVNRAKNSLEEFTSLPILAARHYKKPIGVNLFIIQSR